MKTMSELIQANTAIDGYLSMKCSSKVDGTSTVLM